MGRTCRDPVEYFYARSGVAEVAVGVPGYPTRVYIERPVPGTVVAVGEAVVVAGYVVYVDPATGEERSLVGARVEVYVDGELVATAVTGAGGTYSASLRFAKPGTYTVRVRFPGG